MSEEEKLPQENLPQDQPPAEPVVYASPIKRVWAWVGVVYMVIIVLLITYMLGFGRYLQGIGGLMVCPAIAGIFVSLSVLWREKSQTKRPALLFLLQGLCIAAFLLSLLAGIPALITNFGA